MRTALIRFQGSAQAMDAAPPFLLPRPVLLALFVVPVALACFDYALLSFDFRNLFRYLVQAAIVLLVLTDREGGARRRLAATAALVAALPCLAAVLRLAGAPAALPFGEGLARAFDSDAGWLWLAGVWLATPVLTGGRRYSIGFRVGMAALVGLQLFVMASVVNSRSPGAGVRVYENELGLFVALAIGWVRAACADSRLCRRGGKAMAVWMAVLTVCGLGVALAALLGGEGVQQRLGAWGMVYLEQSWDLRLPRWRLNFPTRYFNRAGHFYMLATATFVLAAMAGGATRRARIGWLALAAAAIYLMELTGTRGAIIATVIGLMLWGALCSWRLLASIFLVMAVAFAMLPPAKRGVILSIFKAETYTLAPENPTSMSLRYAGWRTAAVMIGEAPLSGIGHGHETIYEHYREYAGRTGDIEVKRHLHNVVLEFAAESGLPAAALLLAWFAVRWWMLGQGIRMLTGRARGRLAAWLALELALFVVGLVSFSLRRPFGLLTWAFWAGALVEAEIWRRPSSGGGATAPAQPEVPAQEPELPPLTPERAAAWAAYERAKEEWLRAHAHDSRDDGLTPLPQEADRESQLRGRRAAGPAGRALYQAGLLALTALAAVLERLPRRRRPIGDRPIRVMRLIGRASMGGVAKVTNQTLLRIDPLSVHTVLVVFGRRGPVSRRIARAPGVRVVRRPLELWPPSWNFRLFRDINRLRKLIRKHRPDLIHLHEPGAAPAVRIAAALAGVPYLVQLHSTYSRRRGHYVPLHRRLERAALRRAWMIGHSAEVVEDGLRVLDGRHAPGRRIALVEDGIDDLRLWRANAAQEGWMLQQAAGRPIVMLIARLVPLKRIGDFLAVVRRLIDAGTPLFPVLMLYGGSQAVKRAFRREFETTFAPGEAELFQFVGTPQDLMRHATLGVSCSEVEGLPKNILEFLALGVPVVCSDIPQHRRLVVDGKNGLLYPLGDLEALQERVARLLGDAGLREQLGRAGRDGVAHRRWADTARGVVQVYREIVGGDGKA